MSEHPIDPAMPLDRLDMMLVASGLVESRSKAQRLIKAGHVRVDGEAITKPSFMVKAGHCELAVDKGDDYVSRGAYKLLGAFKAFADDGLTGPQSLECLDIGASTGGFTDVLLRGGAARVVALDVGHGQLDPRIAGDSRVIEMSGVNIREVTADDLPYRPAMIVSDVSFISLTYVIPVIARIAAPGAQVVLLVKPQFEVGRKDSASMALWAIRHCASRPLPMSSPVRGSTGCTSSIRPTVPLKACTVMRNICFMRFSNDIFGILG